MPLHINLLAESQALEEMRRRDPVKRAIMVGIFLGILVLAWSGYLQSRTIVAARQIAVMQAKLHSNTNEYQLVLASKKKLDDATQKLAKLQQYSTNRFLSGPVLNALQQVTVEDVQLTHFKTDQIYTYTPEVKAKKDGDGVVTTKGKPAISSEKITLTLDGRDTSEGDHWVKYKSAVSDCSFFQTLMGRKPVVCTSTQVQTEPAGPDGKKNAKFTLEVIFPEKIR